MSDTAPVASFNGTPLWFSTPDRPKGGLVAYLNQKATDDTVTVIDGVEVQTWAGSRCILVRGLDAHTFEACLALGVGSANRGLDLLAIGGFLAASLDDTDACHIAWVEGVTGVSVRIWSGVRMPMRAGLVTAIVHDAAGNERVSPSIPEPVWHEAFRYFRLAQVTDDLFNAFRNSYLALEALLSSISPQKLGPSGRPSESEGAWFRRALAQAGTLVDLSQYTVAQDASTALDDIFDELYVKARTAAFHAKAGRPILIPLDALSRPQVTDAIRRLGRLVVDLSAAVNGTRYRSGAVFAAGFALMGGRIVDGSTIYLSDDESDPDPAATEVAHAGRAALAMPTSRAPAVEEPFFLASQAEMPAADVAIGLPYVSRVVLAESESGPLACSTLEGRLDPKGLDRLVVVMGLRGVNTRVLRTNFGA